MPLSIVFFGTPQPAATTLQALVDSDHQVRAVVTAPDRPKGRGMRVSPSPVKDLARRSTIDVLQPPSLRSGDVHATLEGFGADLFVVTAYGLILPREVLDIPRMGCLNIHFSLLPKLRGAAPIQWALIERHSLTGVTIMQMDEGLDTGPILAQEEEPILPEDTAETLEERLTSKGAELLVKVLDRLSGGPLEAHPQNDDEATIAAKLTPADARLDWTEDAEALESRVRAMHPKPGAWTTFRGKRLKIFKVALSSEVSNGPPGALEVVDKDLVSVATGSTRLILEELQPEGKSRMTLPEFLRGYRCQSGESFS